MQLAHWLARGIAYGLLHTLYRVRVSGSEQLPKQSAAIVICNHVSYLDALLLISASPRPLRFVIDKAIYETPLGNAIFKAVRSIPITAIGENRRAFKAAFAAVHESLAAGELIAIFPEGELTRTGEMGKFQRGIELMLRQDAVPVIPAHLEGLWGSFYSRYHGLFRGRSKGFRRSLRLRFGAPLPATTTAAEMRVAVANLQRLD